MLATVQQNWAPFLAGLGARAAASLYLVRVYQAVALYIVPQLDFPSKAPNTSFPPDFQIQAGPGISRRICNCKLFNSTFFLAISNRKSLQPRSETVGDICFIQKGTASGNWLNTNTGGLTAELVPLLKQIFNHKHQLVLLMLQTTKGEKLEGELICAPQVF